MITDSPVDSTPPVLLDMIDLEEGGGRKEYAEGKRETNSRERVVHKVLKREE
jgi:hypothetical protein